MKNKLKRFLVLGFISILVFIGCPNDSSGKGPPVCENEDCKCEDCDGKECDCNEEQGPVDPIDITRANINFLTDEDADFTQAEIDAIKANINALDAEELAEFDGYVTAVEFAKNVAGSPVIYLGTGEDATAEILIESTANTAAIMAALNAAKDEVTAERDEAHHNIGTFAGIQIRIAEGVARAEGEHALDRIQAYDTTGAFPGGGRVADRSGGVITKIIVISAPESEDITVAHKGNGVLEVRLSTHESGGIHGILGTGRGLIEDNIISFLQNLLQKDKVYA